MSNMDTSSHIKEKIVTTEMKYLRRILNVSRLDKSINENIRQRIGVTSVLAYIKKQQLKWFSHVSILPQNGISQKDVTLRCNGGRDKGRPRRYLCIYDIANTKSNTVHQSDIVTYYSSSLYAVRHPEKRGKKL
jgi:hypothetical protein